MKKDKKTETTMRDRRKWLKEWIKLRNYNVGVRTSVFLECYHMTNQALYSTEMSLNLLKSMNEKMKTPLPDEDVEKIAAKTLKRITNKTIILWLDITEEEEKLLQIGHNMKLKEDRFNRQLDAAILMDQIQSMFADGKRAAEIAKEVTLVSKRTILRYIAEYRKNMQTEQDRQDLVKAVRELYQETEDYNAIARRTKCSVDTVRQILNVEGMTEMTKQDAHKETTEPDCFTESEGRDLYKLFQRKTSEEVTNIDEYTITLDILRTYSNAISITGAAGAGKSHICKAFLAALSPSERAATLVVAPTGKAADNLNAQTIHKAFHFPNDVQPNTEVTSAPEHLFKISRIIIDEVNMVRQDVFTRMIKTLRFVEQQTQKKIQIITLGDFGQIQPVATPADMDLLQEFYPSAKGVYAFHSEEWEALNFRKIVLKRIYRQDDPVFKEKLNQIKYGNITAIQWFNENASAGFTHHGITICPTNRLVDHYNKEAWSLHNPDEMVEYIASLKDGTINEELPCPDILKLSKGMRVMTICNSDKYKNGSIGTIIETKKKSIKVQFDNGTMATVRRQRFILQDGVTYEQLPVVLGYAITANKAEGMTFENINIVPGFFAPGQLYTALSRCTSISGIHLERKLTKKDLYVDIEALRMTIDES